MRNTYDLAAQLDNKFLVEGTTPTRPEQSLLEDRIPHAIRKGKEGHCLGLSPVTSLRGPINLDSLRVTLQGKL